MSMKQLLLELVEIWDDDDDPEMEVYFLD